MYVLCEACVSVCVCVCVLCYLPCCDACVVVVWPSNSLVYSMN